MQCIITGKQSNRYIHVYWNDWFKSSSVTGHIRVFFYGDIVNKFKKKIVVKLTFLNHFKTTHI